MFEKSVKNILVIKHGAFGDLIHATSVFRALRTFYSQDKLVLLTDPRFKSLTGCMPYFDEIVFDDRRRTLRSLLKIRSFLRKGQFDFVFDLQVTKRTNSYYWFFFPSTAPQWSGSAFNCSHYIGNPSFNLVHVQDRFKLQLIQAGVLGSDSVSLTPDVSWLKADSMPPEISSPFVLMVPGSSKAHLVKRWPASYYQDLALRLIHKGYQVVLIGGPDEREILDSLSQSHPWIHAPSSLNFHHIATLGRRAHLAIGNDTGPSHIIAATGCPIFYCWSGASSPTVFAPRGSHVTILCEPNLKNLTPNSVWERLQL